MQPILFLNPHKRGRKARRSRKARRAAAIFTNPTKKRRHRKARSFIHRNPLPTPRGIVKSQVMPALHGSIGAIFLSAANGMLIDRLPVPATVKTGVLRDVLKGATAVGIGMLANKLGKREFAHSVAVGAMTMVLTDAARRAMLKFLPTVKLAGIEQELMGFASVESLGGIGNANDPLLALTTDTRLGMTTELAGNDPLLASLGGYDPTTGEYT